MWVRSNVKWYAPTVLSLLPVHKWDMKGKSNLCLHTMCNCFTDDTIRVTDEYMLKQISWDKDEDDDCGSLPLKKFWRIIKAKHWIVILHIVFIQQHVQLLQYERLIQVQCIPLEAVRQWIRLWTNLWDTFLRFNWFITCYLLICTKYTIV